MHLEKMHIENPRYGLKSRQNLIWYILYCSIGHVTSHMGHVTGRIDIDMTL